MDLAFQLSPAQLPVCTEETSQPRGWETARCFGANRIVLKQLRICATEDAENTMSSHYISLVSFELVAQMAAKQRRWIQLRSPVGEPQSSKEGAENY